MHGYDTYDYGARGYYPAMGRFTSVDPHAEKYYSISPYAYCEGNPVNAIDPNGKDKKPATDKTTAIDNTSTQVPQKIAPIQAPPDLVKKEEQKTEKSTDKNAQLSQTNKMIVTPEDKATSGNIVVQSAVVLTTAVVIVPEVVVLAETMPLIPVTEGIVKSVTNAPPDAPYLIETPSYMLISDFSNASATTLKNVLDSFIPKTINPTTDGKKKN